MGEPVPAAAVVVNYNAGDALVSCVKSLLGDEPAEVVVVDNASTDGSLGRLLKEIGHVRVVESRRNLGYGKGANLGARETAGPYLVVCNPDLVVSPGALATLVARLEHDQSLGVVGPMLRDTAGEVYPSGRDFPALADALGHAFIGLIWGANPWTRRYRHLGGDQHRARPADWVSGAFMVLRREAFLSVGGFDDAYFMYMEDVDLCWRLRRAGWGCFYEPAAEVRHEQGRSTARHPYRMLVAHHVSMWRFARRTASDGERLLIPAMAAGLCARLVLAWSEHLLRPVRDWLKAPARLGDRARR